MFCKSENFSSSSRHNNTNSEFGKETLLWLKRSFYIFFAAIDHVIMNISNLHASYVPTP